MKKTLSFAFAAAVGISITITALTCLAFTRPTNNVQTDINIQKLTQVASHHGLNPRTLKAALNAYEWAYDHHELGSNKQILTIVDFSLPSYKKRLWVIDLKNDKVLMKLYVTNGFGSFSNKSGTHASCLGLFTTANIYYGRHGESMRINGLEKGINNNTLARAIVIHGAWYATPKFVQEYHRTGRSWGCFAVDPAAKDELYKDIKGGSVLFAYAAAENHDAIVKNGPIDLF